MALYFRANEIASSETLNLEKDLPRADWTASQRHAEFSIRLPRNTSTDEVQFHPHPIDPPAESCPFLLSWRGGVIRVL
jgi:hypothetical protein